MIGILFTFKFALVAPLLLIIRERKIGREREREREREGCEEEFYFEHI